VRYRIDREQLSEFLARQVGHRRRAAALGRADACCLGRRRSGQVRRQKERLAAAFDRWERITVAPTSRQQSPTA
jgi:hypothetical protein